MGGGLAGLRTAESIRAKLPIAEITIICEEDCYPYNRPPLSKEALQDGPSHASLEFRRKESILNINWIFADPAISVSYPEREIILSSGRKVSFDILVVATGIRPRQLNVSGNEKTRYSLRNIEEAKTLFGALSNSKSVILIGAGFIGCEVAATARKKGIEVTIVAADAEPMIRPLGLELGAAMRRRHEKHGVRFHMDASISSYVGDDFARGVELTGGEVIEADLVIEAIGSLPNTEWLAGGPLNLQDGVLVDSYMRATKLGDVNIYAVGDVAKYVFELFDDEPRRIEHWNLPTETGRRAGSSIASLILEEDPTHKYVDFIPSFWSDQYDYRLQSFGLPGLGSNIEVVDGSIDGPCIVEYFRQRELVGVIGIDTGSKLAKYKTIFADRRLGI